MSDNNPKSLEELRVKVDPAGKYDPTTKQKQFLTWTLIKENGEDVYKAVGRDGTVYKIIEDKPPVIKNYKLIIEDEKETPNKVDPRPIRIENVDNGMDLNE